MSLKTQGGRHSGFRARRGAYKSTPLLSMFPDRQHDPPALPLRSSSHSLHLAPPSTLSYSPALHRSLFFAGLQSPILDHLSPLSLSSDLYPPSSPLVCRPSTLPHDDRPPSRLPGRAPSVE